jgi:hypothetical protein
VTEPGGEPDIGTAFVFLRHTMTEPAKFDDDWAELARELERDKPSTPPSPNECPSPTPNSSVSGEEGFADYPTESMDEANSDEFDDAGEGGDDAGEGGSESDPNGDAASGDGQPGTGRKRRRRRRRRRKGGQPAEAGTAEETESEKADAGEGETEDSVFELVPVVAETESDEAEYGDEPGDEIVEDTVEISAAEMEEDAGGELLRELIANWNVPSWDDVVGGLYRPER